MVKLTQSLSQWLFDNHREKLALIMFGHTELLTDEMWNEYIAWCKTDEGKQYLKGGIKYNGEDDEYLSECQLTKGKRMQTKEMIK